MNHHRHHLCIGGSHCPDNDLAFDLLKTTVIVCVFYNKESEATDAQIYAPAAR